MKKIILVLVVFSTLQVFSQQKASVELNYPIPTGDNFMSNYTGLIDVGFKYRFSDKKDFTFGVSLNANHLTYSEDYENIRFKTKNYNIQPRVFAELKLKGAPRFHPALGLGYTFMQFSSKGSSITSSEDPIKIDNSQNLSGLNYNISFTFDFAKKFYAQAQYDGIKIGSTPEGVPDTKYNTTAAFLKLGIGYRF